MRGFTEATLLGNLAMKPKISFTPNQKKTAFVVIAVETRWTDRDTKEQKSLTRFIPLKAWGNKADLLEKYCDKGDRLLVKGYLDTQVLPAKEGEKPKSRLFVVATDLTFLSSKQKAEEIEIENEETGGFVSLTEEEVAMIDNGDMPVSYLGQ